MGFLHSRLPEATTRESYYDFSSYKQFETLPIRRHRRREGASDKGDPRRQEASTSRHGSTPFRPVDLADGQGSRL